MTARLDFLDREWPERLRRGVKAVLRHCDVSQDEWARGGYDVHHVVAAGLDGAAAGRAVLGRWSIGIHSVANAVVIPRLFHQQQGLHRLSFLQFVNQRVVSGEMFAEALSAHAGRAAGRLILVQTIQQIGNELVLRSGDGVAIRLQGALRRLASDEKMEAAGASVPGRGGGRAAERTVRRQGFGSAEGADRADAPVFGHQRSGFQLPAIAV